MFYIQKHNFHSIYSEVQGEKICLSYSNKQACVCAHAHALSIGLLLLAHWRPSHL